MPRSKKSKKHKRLTTYAFNKPNKPEYVVVVGSKSNKSNVKAEKETKEKLAENPKKRNLINSNKKSINTKDEFKLKLNIIFINNNIQVQYYSYFGKKTIQLKGGNFEKKTHREK